MSMSTAQLSLLGRFWESSRGVSPVRCADAHVVHSLILSGRFWDSRSPAMGPERCADAHVVHGPVKSVGEILGE